MNKKWIAVIGTGALIIGIAITRVSFAESDDNDIRNGTIRTDEQSEAEFPSMGEAVQKAQASVQGQILKTELDNENGFLVFGVEVVTADKAIVDVKINAGSGKILSMDKDKADEADHEYGDQGDRDHED